MDDTGRVDPLEGCQQIPPQPESVPPVQRSAFQSLGQGLSLDQVHHVVGETVFLIGVVDRDHVGVGKRGQGPGLAKEARLPDGRGHVGSQHLDGHHSFQGGVAGAEHRGHAAGGDLAVDFVARRQGVAQPFDKGWH